MTSYIAMGHSQASVDSYTRALWHAIHHPNLALDAPSPLLLNWYRHALEWGGWQLRPGANFTVVAAAAAAAGGTNATDSRGRSSGVAGNGTGAAGSRRLQQQQQSGSATAGDSELLQQRRERLAEVVTDEVTRFFRLAAAVQGTELVRSMHATYIGGAYAPPKVVVNTAAADESGDGTKLLVTVIVVPVAGTALLLGVVVVAVVMYMRRHNRDMLGRNSTNLWESLDTEVMEEAMAKHHAVFRGLLSKHHGYETATEGS
ncbi:hypothetical protein HXX76_013155 [Chlamydomonas incerta]|uniref:Uncharacterized protein n=1 Tax=Chlamydomonas incerta TaxID=51695 RepID=A0A835SFT3_CHLIN|nr:hypothetical protein HXX76_013155 [Chlamydomonas incerta]|eukprot:KAG2426174.1 hypothetical protein HXX76_013155 [Chlamydomonas incerta]